MIWQRMLIVLALAVAVVLTALVAGIRRRDSVNRAFMLATSVVSISLALQTLLMIPCYLGLEEPFLRVQVGLLSLCSLCFLLLSLAVARCPFDGVSRLLSWSTAVVALLQVFADLAYVGFEGQGADAVPLIETKLSLVMMLVTAANIAYGVWLMEGRRRRVANAADKSILIIVEAGFVVALVLLVALMIVLHWLRPGVFPVALEGPAFCLALIVVYQGVWRHSMLDLTVRSAAGSLFECATDGIVLLDTEERVSRINPAGLRLFWMDEGVPNDGALDEALRRLLPEPEAHERLVTFASSGQVRHMLASKTRYIEQGMSLGFVLVLSDATAIVEAQTRLRSFHDGLAREVERRAEQLAEAQRLAAVGGLARNVAHVLNNQLAVVIGMTESALDRCEPDTSLHSDLCDVLNAAVNARDVIAQIGPDGHGNGDLASATSLRRVLKEVHKTLSAGLPRNIKVRFAYDEDHHVLGNATQLLQVFVNLGKNARDAMLETGGVLELKLSSVDAGVGLRAAFEHLRPGKLAQVMVVDTGMGMTAEVQKKIFEPLFTTKAEGIGTGLGLASAKRIVEEHKGAIAVESSLGQGTRFTVYLPVIDRTSHEPQPADLVYLGGTERVLVVDDEPEVAKATGTALAALGYVVEVCHSPIDALELVGATDEPFQLVITDQVMPRMPGLELAARLKALHPETPIILLSGTATEEILRKAEAVGVELVLSKPVTRSALARAVRGELDR